MEYKKRHKTKESTGIATLLQSSPKNQMLSQAYFFALVNKSMEDIFENLNPALVPDIKSCSVFVQHSIKSVKITIKSGDKAFLVFVKTELEGIREELTAKLIEKKVLDAEEELSLLVKGI